MCKEYFIKTYYYQVNLEHSSVFEFVTYASTKEDTPELVSENNRKDIKTLSQQYKVKQESVIPVTKEQYERRKTYEI